jgi:integrase
MLSADLRSALVCRSSSFDAAHHRDVLLRAGEHPNIVSERLGHSQVAVTLNTYSDVLPTMHREAAGKIDAALAGVIG